MNVLLEWAALFAQGCFVLGLLCALVRLLRGPAAPDRVLALDSAYLNAMLIVLAMGIRYGTNLYFDIALLIGLFGFVGSAAVAKFLLKGELIEP